MGVNWLGAFAIDQNSEIFMESNAIEWDYCTIRYQIRYKGEDMTRSGNKHMWLVFLAKMLNSMGQGTVRESTEIPVPANIIGTTITPQKNNPSHISIHQNLIQGLQAEGWELLPEQSSAWWERRLRRKVLSKSHKNQPWFGTTPSPTDWLCWAANPPNHGTFGFDKWDGIRLICLKEHMKFAAPQSAHFLSVG